MLAMAGVLAGYLELVLPRQKPPQDLHIVITPELQERDRYIVENVAVRGDRDGRWVLGNDPLYLLHNHELRILVFYPARVNKKTR